MLFLWTKPASLVTTPFLTTLFIVRASHMGHDLLLYYTVGTRPLDLESYLLSCLLLILCHLFPFVSYRATLRPVPTPSSVPFPGSLSAFFWWIEASLCLCFIFRPHDSLYSVASPSMNPLTSFQSFTRWYALTRPLGIIPSLCRKYNTHPSKPV